MLDSDALRQRGDKTLTRRFASDAGLGYIRTGRRGRHNVFEPIEAVRGRAMCSATCVCVFVQHSV